jgi:hypothetical protein
MASDSNGASSAVAPDSPHRPPQPASSFDFSAASNDGLFIGEWWTATAATLLRTGEAVWVLAPSRLHWQERIYSRLKFRTTSANPPVDVLRTAPCCDKVAPVAGIGEWCGTVGNSVGTHHCHPFFNGSGALIVFMATVFSFVDLRQASPV